MRRADMEQDRWYLIRFGCGEKAGRVIDENVVGARFLTGLTAQIATLDAATAAH
jgi:hypothetical protein